jgi:hypothetical protein
LTIKIRGRLLLSGVQVILQRDCVVKVLLFGAVDKGHPAHGHVPEEFLYKFGIPVKL